MSVLNFIWQAKLKYKHFKLSETYVLFDYNDTFIITIKHLREKNQAQPKAKLTDNVLITLAVNKLPNSQTNAIFLDATDTYQP